MVKYENDCCDCATGGYPCRGSSCSLRHVPHLYCDKCRYEVEELYHWEDEEWCLDCIVEHGLERVEVEE